MEQASSTNGDRSRRHENVRVYEDRWGRTGHVVQLRPNLWRHIAPRVNGGRVLEIGPGLRPTAPVPGSFFVEVSRRATESLRRAGGRVAQVGDWRLPFRDGSFDLVIALEVLEHVEEDASMLGELVRVLKPGGVAVVSVPLHMSRWSPIDEACAHVRRYEPEELLGKLRDAGLQPETYQTRRARNRPFLARVAATALTSMPGVTNWWLQRMVYPFQSVWQRHLEELRWTDVRVPIPSAAAGTTVVAARRGEGQPAKLADTTEGRSV
jgi:SAM-dependent methyltransferase